MTKEFNVELLPAQAEFMLGRDTSKNVDISLYQGGLGSGKTFCGALRGVLFALQWAGIRGLVGAATQDLLDGTTKVKYLEHLENIGLVDGIHYWLSDRGNTLNFINGSTIRFKTLSDWTQFRSTEFGFIEIEEASFVDEKTFKELLGRLRQQPKPEWKNFYWCMFLHTNPQGSRGWIYKLFHDKKRKTTNYRSVIAPSKENVYLREGYVEELKAIYSASEVQEMLEGIDCDKDNTIAFPDFNKFNIVDNLAYNPDYPLILTCDFNYNPMCWYLVQNIGDKWNILKEFVHNNVTTKQMCQTIINDINTYGRKSLIIMGDSHGRDKKTNGSDYGVMTVYFAQQGYDVTLKVQKANPLIIERLAVLRRTICNGKMERKLFVDSSCTYLLKNFDECRNNLATGALKIPTDKEIAKDDELRYLIHPIDAISYPIYYIQKYKDITGEE